MSNSSKFQAKLLKIISVNNNLNERSFQSGINVLCCYDPEGVIIKFARGELVRKNIIQTFLCVANLRPGKSDNFFPRISLTAILLF